MGFSVFVFSYFHDFAIYNVRSHLASEPLAGEPLAGEDFGWNKSVVYVPKVLNFLKIYYTTHKSKMS